MERLRELGRDLGGLVMVVALMSLVYLLPPDTSLREVEAGGTLRVCLPAAYPPLVTGDPAAPGIDVEILTALAERLGVRLAPNTVEAMGQDFNPRDWGVTRGRCQLLAGGVVDSRVTRSFLDVGPAYATTGWGWVAAAPFGGLEGRRIGVLALVSGLDRIGLASALRAAGAQAVVVPTAEALAAGLSEGRFEAGVTEALLAGQIAGANGWQAGFLPVPLPRYSLVFGLWKGDLTLKRAVRRAFSAMERDGTIDAIFARYGIEREAVAPAS
jgi:ABC-type amino acid transport substrate-binding protein